ncbi:GNAT family N-acetyltransferase [Curtobacterium ammoniigenes]|uniref:GNAT family N-acetyltransferase n=1 Tax=Curtobacterium ammoniigenes TaxID=395387 RepID=UPI000AE1AFF8|nr:GNAT family N-acetyltransferase [Curtobacterium ammoniigenes]
MPDHSTQRADARIRCARWVELTTDELYEIVRLRNRVFALEQRVEAEDFDGRDRADETEHWWMPDEDGGVRAYLRLLRPAPDEVHPPDALPPRWVIGRVATDPAFRGRGLAHGLVTAVLGRHGSEPMVLHAQEYVAGLYAASGFVPFGESYDEAGIRHRGMYRAGQTAAQDPRSNKVEEGAR